MIMSPNHLIPRNWSPGSGRFQDEQSQSQCERYNPDCRLKYRYRETTGTEKGYLIDLTPNEFDLLRVMAENPGRVFSRMQLLDKVQGDAYEGYERTIDSHIKNLRKKLEPDPEHPRYIVTVYGVGYKMEEN